MEAIELMTGSRILSMNFNEYDALVSASGLQDPNRVTVTEEQIEAVSGEQPAEEVPTEETNTEDENAPAPVSTIAVETLPPSLKLVTFEVEVASPEYEKLQQFIKEIEKIERVMHIDRISYSLEGEEKVFDAAATDTVTAMVQVTTFYYE